MIVIINLIQYLLTVNIIWWYRQCVDILTSIWQFLFINLVIKLN